MRHIPLNYFFWTFCFPTKGFGPRYAAFRKELT